MEKLACQFTRLDQPIVGRSWLWGTPLGNALHLDGCVRVRPRGGCAAKRQKGPSRQTGTGDCRETFIASLQGGRGLAGHQVVLRLQVDMSVSVGHLRPSSIGLHPAVEPDGNPLLGLDHPADLVVVDGDEGEAAGGTAHAAQAVEAARPVLQRSSHQDSLLWLLDHSRQLWAELNVLLDVLLLLLEPLENVPNLVLVLLFQG